MSNVARWFMCLLLCVIGGGLEGCAVLAPRYHQRKEAERQHQEKIKYLESLNSCGSAEWFNKCKSNELPPYRSIAVHVKPWMVIHVNEGPKPLYLQDAERIAERILCLPLYPSLEVSKVDFIASLIEENHKLNF